MVYPSGQQVAVNHDDEGRMQSLTYNPGDTSGYLTGMGYKLAGQVTGLTLGNGVVESYGYDPNRPQLTTQTATKGATSLMNLTYNYQAAGGQMGAGSTAGNAGQLMSIGGTINSTTESASYAYDLLGRLTESGQTSNGVNASRYFVYDRWGNRTQVQLDKESAPIQTITLEQSGGVPTNRITSVTSGSTVNYTYDAAGNVTNDGAHTYTYDAENRVVSVDGGASAQYRYDHQNRRVTKIVGSSWTHYIWEGAQVIAEHDATTPYSTNPTYQVKSARLDYIHSGGRMIHSRQRTSSTAPWTTRYYLSDRLSVRITLDTSGNVVGRQGHLPFGESFGESAIQEKHRFTSYERDAESALDYAINRFSQLSLGRFNQVDSVSGRASVPQSLNRYSYGLNEPIDVTDSNRKEIEALIATAVNRQTYNIAYFFDNSRPHFVDLSNPQGNPAPTLMMDILSLTGYVAFAPKLGTRKVSQQRLLNLRRYGRAVLFEGDVACDQLKAAKQFAIQAGTLTGAAVFELYPITFNHAGIAFEPGRRRSTNIRRYGSTTFWNHIFGPPQT